MPLLDRLRGLVQPKERLLMPARQFQAAEGIAERQEALSIPLPGGMSLDPDEHLFRRLTTGAKLQRRDLSPLAQDRMLEITWYLWEQNAFAKRLVTLMTDLVVGEGVTVTAKDERIQQVIDRTWYHPTNQLQTRTREFHNFLSVTGELILPVQVNPVDGRLVLGFLDPYQVKDILTVPDNILITDQVLMKAEGGQAEGRRLQIVRVDPTTGRLAGECFAFGVNKLPNSTRGRSDLGPLADWLDLYDQYMFAEVERLQLLSNFVWDYTIEGASSDQAIRDKVKALGVPKPGSVFGHNEKESLTPRTPDLKATDRSEVARLLRTHIAGSMGFPLSYLGEIDANKATIEGQNDILLKTPTARQDELKSFITQVVQFAIEQALGKNPSLFRQVDQTFEVGMPEIAAKDVARVGQVLQAVATAMDTMLANRTISRQAAITVQTAVVSHLGVDLDPQELMDQADDEADAAQEFQDQVQAEVARQRVAGPKNPPVPGEEPPDDGDQAAA